MITATLKVPVDEVERYSEELKRLGVDTIEVQIIPYEQFVAESRLNYDCVYPQMWEEKKAVAYLVVRLDSSEESRKKMFQLEYHIMQIPLNIRYEF